MTRLGYPYHLYRIRLVARTTDFQSVNGSSILLCGTTSGYSPVWLRRPLWERKTGGSNPSIPTIYLGTYASGKRLASGAKSRRFESDSPNHTQF